MVAFLGQEDVLGLAFWYVCICINVICSLDLQPDQGALCIVLCSGWNWNWGNRGLYLRCKGMRFEMRTPSCYALCAWVRRFYICSDFLFMDIVLHVQCMYIWDCRCIDVMLCLIYHGSIPGYRLYIIIIIIIIGYTLYTYIYNHKPIQIPKI